MILLIQLPVVSLEDLVMRLVNVASSTLSAQLEVVSVTPTTSNETTPVVRIHSLHIFANSLSSVLSVGRLIYN